MTTEKPTILIVDDDTAHRSMLDTLITSWGYQTDQAPDGGDAVEKVKARPYDLVLMDVRMLKVSGIEALARIKAYNPAIPVMIMTAYSSVETAVAALKKGAYDYLTKPLDFDKLKHTLKRAMAHLRLTTENRMLKTRLSDLTGIDRFIGQSPAVRRILETVKQVAPSEATVLITGESGTGKELIAGGIHDNSPRKNGPFVGINCAAVTETLLESELFGHEKGAFTGAVRRKEGRFVQADGGTLFLDEIGEMPLTMQVKLLRVLQEREVVRVGGEAVIKVDVRFVAATNRRLPDMISVGKFRSDLYYRLNVVGIDLPPLKHRREDIPLLARHFLKRFARESEKVVEGFSPAAMDHLIRHDWPGNVRELMNVVERAVVLCNDAYIDTPLLPFGDAEKRPESSYDPSDTADVSLEEAEKAAVLRTLNKVGGNKSEAARRLKITRKTLHKKLKKYGVMPDRG